MSNAERAGSGPGEEVPPSCISLSLAIKWGHAAGSMRSFALSLLKVLKVFPFGSWCVVELPS